VLLVNPIIDGMNLVAKEGLVVNQRNGVLVLSRTAGAF
jgi:trehalose 6-phosphate synthase